MHATTIIGLLVAFYTALAAAVETERSIDVFAWPLSSPKSSTFATVTYNSTAATIKSYSAPSLPSNDHLVRVGFYHASGQWSGIATSASNFAAEKDKKLQLHVNSEGEVYHIGFKASVSGTHSRQSNKKDDLSVDIIKQKPGPTPHLNKPVVMNPDGTVPQKEPEKTFLQKYWWAIAGFLVLQVVISGGKDK